MFVVVNIGAVLFFGISTVVILHGGAVARCYAQARARKTGVWRKSLFSLLEIKSTKSAVRACIRFEVGA